MASTSETDDAHERGSASQAGQGALSGKYSLTRRATCHRCANVRKRNVFCTGCPRVVCEVCAVKWISEHGADAFTAGCPICKGMCCCADGPQTHVCNRLFHCNRRCPAIKNSGLATNSGSFAGALPEPDPSRFAVTVIEATKLARELVAGPERKSALPTMPPKRKSSRWAAVRDGYAGDEVVGVSAPATVAMGPARAPRAASRSRRSTAGVKRRAETESGDEEDDSDGTASASADVYKPRRTTSSGRRVRAKHVEQQQEEEDVTEYIPAQRGRGAAAVPASSGSVAYPSTRASDEDDIVHTSEMEARALHGLLHLQTREPALQSQQQLTERMARSVASSGGVTSTYMHALSTDELLQGGDAGLVLRLFAVALERGGASRYNIDTLLDLLKPLVMVHTHAGARRSVVAVLCEMTDPHAGTLARTLHPSVLSELAQAASLVIQSSSLPDGADAATREAAAALQPLAGMFSTLGGHGWNSNLPSPGNGYSMTQITPGMTGGAPRPSYSYGWGAAAAAAGAPTSGMYQEAGPPRVSIPMRPPPAAMHASSMYDGGMTAGPPTSQGGSSAPTQAATAAAGVYNASLIAHQSVVYERAYAEASTAVAHAVAQCTPIVFSVPASRLTTMSAALVLVSSRVADMIERSMSAVSAPPQVAQPAQPEMKFAGDTPALGSPGLFSPFANTWAPHVQAMHTGGPGTSLSLPTLSNLPDMSLRAPASSDVIVDASSARSILPRQDGISTDGAGVNPWAAAVDAPPTVDAAASSAAPSAAAPAVPSTGMQTTNSIHIKLPAGAATHPLSSAPTPTPGAWFDPAMARVPAAHDRQQQQPPAAYAVLPMASSGTAAAGGGAHQQQFEFLDDLLYLRATIDLLFNVVRESSGAEVNHAPPPPAPAAAMGLHRFALNPAAPGMHMIPAHGGLMSGASLRTGGGGTPTGMGDGGMVYYGQAPQHAAPPPSHPYIMPQHAHMYAHISGGNTPVLSGSTVPPLSAASAHLSGQHGAAMRM